MALQQNQIALGTLALAMNQKKQEIQSDVAELVSEKIGDSSTWKSGEDSKADAFVAAYDSYKSTKQTENSNALNAAFVAVDDAANLVEHNPDVALNSLKEAEDEMIANKADFDTDKSAAILRMAANYQAARDKFGVIGDFTSPTIATPTVVSIA